MTTVGGAFSAPDTATAGGHFQPVRITADDYGLAPCVNAAIEDLAQARRITAVSVMVHRTAALDSAHSLALLPVRTGLHLVFVEELPLLHLDHDWSKALPSNWRALLAKLVTRPTFARRLVDEARAQIERFQGLGLRLDFINSHQHAHLLPPLWRALVPLFAEYADTGVRIAARGWFEPNAQGMLHVASRCDEFLWPPRNADNTFPLGLQGAGQANIRALAKVAGRFAKSGLAQRTRGEVVTHPGHETSALRMRYAHWRYHWQEEYIRLRRGEVHEVLAAAALEPEKCE